MGINGINPEKNAGNYVDPQNWNALIKDPETVVIDTRNAYEVSIGTFKNALNPRTTSFREFPQWLGSQTDLKSKQKVAMFCTGGMRRYIILKVGS